MDGKGPLGIVPEFFAQTEYLLLMETASGTVREVVAREGRGDEELARIILQWNCECVLCGPIEEAPFIIIADEGAVTRYNASGLGLDDALKAFKINGLELIRDHIDGQGCQSTGGGDCHDHH